jgi:hypothetical protein
MRSPDICKSHPNFQGGVTVCCRPFILCLFGFSGFFLSAHYANGQVVAIPGLFATGVDGSNTLLGSNTVDSHYVVTASSLGAAYTGNAYTVKSQAIPNGWTPNLTGARWIVGERSGGGDGNNPSRAAGTFDYTLTFTMPTGAQLATVSINGSGAADDSATIFVNGVLVSGQSITSASATNSFTLDGTNAAFAAGSNTIVFRVNNTSSSDTGLFIGGLSGTVVVPEVGAYLPVVGALAFFFIRRRYRGRKQFEQSAFHLAQPPLS